MACAHATAVCETLSLGVKKSVVQKSFTFKGIHLPCHIALFPSLMIFLLRFLSVFYIVQRPFVLLWQLEIRVFGSFSPIWTQTQLGKIRLFFLFVCVVHNWRKEISTSITKRKGFKLTKSFQYKGKEWFGSICCHSVIISIFFLLDSTVWFWMYICACV